jgi:cell division protein FtsB
VLQNFILIIPHLFLLGLWRERRRRALQIFLVFCVAVLFWLGPLSSRLGRGTLQRLIHCATVLPVGVVGFVFWRARDGAARNAALSRDSRDEVRAT